MPIVSPTSRALRALETYLQYLDTAEPQPQFPLYWRPSDFHEAVKDAVKLRFGDDATTDPLFPSPLQFGNEFDALVARAAERGYRLSAEKRDSNGVPVRGTKLTLEKTTFNTLRNPTALVRVDVEDPVSPQTDPEAILAAFDPEDDWAPAQPLFVICYGRIVNHPEQEACFFVPPANEQTVSLDKELFVSLMRSVEKALGLTQNEFGNWHHENSDGRLYLIPDRFFRRGDTLGWEYVGTVLRRWFEQRGIELQWRPASSAIYGRELLPWDPKYQ
jgi:hypothetical protein